MDVRISTESEFHTVIICRAT